MIAPTLPEDEKARKKAKLEQWKKDQAAKKALDGAKAKAIALAGKSAPGEYYILSPVRDFMISHHLDLCLYSSYGLHDKWHTFKTYWATQSGGAGRLRTKRPSNKT